MEDANPRCRPLMVNISLPRLVPRACIALIVRVT